MPRTKSATKCTPSRRRAKFSKKRATSRRCNPREPASATHHKIRRRLGRSGPAKDNKDTGGNAKEYQKRGKRFNENEPAQDFGGQRLETQQPLLHHRVRALIEAAYSGKLQASNAYDDKVIKRRRMSPSVQLLWQDWNETHMNQHGQAIEKPGYATHNLFGSSDFGYEPRYNDHVASGQAREAADDNSIAALGSFGKLSAEIRDMILCDLLVHYKDIRVLHGWSLLFPRSRPNLQANILRVCRTFYLQGIRVLYGENTFVYLIRDPSFWRSDTAIVLEHVYGQDHIPIDKHGHMIRRIKIVVEANRMRLHDSRMNLPQALQKFLPGGGLFTPARLHTITIELPAQTRGKLGMKRDSGSKRNDVPACSWFRQGSSVLNALKHLNCQFIRILAYTACRDNRGGEYFEAVINRCPHFSQLSADEGNHDVWRSDSVMLAARKVEAARSRARLDTLYHWLEQLTRDVDGNRPIRALLQGPFKVHVPQTETGEPLEALPSGSSTRSRRHGTMWRMNYGLSTYFLESDNENNTVDTEPSDEGSDEEEDDYDDEGDEDEDSFFTQEMVGRGCQT